MFCYHFAKLSHKNHHCWWGCTYVSHAVYSMSFFYAADARHQDIMPMSIHPSRIWVLFNTLGGCYAKNCNGMKQEQVFRCYTYESEADGFCLSLQILAIACHVIFHSSLTVQSCTRQLNTLTNRITTFVVCSFLKTQSHRSLVDSKYEP